MIPADPKGGAPSASSFPLSREKLNLRDDAPAGVAEPSRMITALRRSVRVEAAPGPVPSRPAGTSLLLSPRRLEVLLAAASYPGIHLRSLSRLLLSSLPALRHHVGVLEAAGLVRPLRRGRRVHVFVTSLFPPREEAFLLILADPVDRRVIVRVGAGPEAGRRELAGDLRMSRSALDRSLRRLKTAGAVRVTRRSGRARVSPSAAWRRFEASCAEAAERRIVRFAAVLEKEGLHPTVEPSGPGRARILADGPRGRLRFVYVANPFFAPAAA